MDDIAHKRKLNRAFSEVRLYICGVGGVRGNPPGKLESQGKRSNTGALCTTFCKAMHHCLERQYTTYLYSIHHIKTAFQ